MRRGEVWDRVMRRFIGAIVLTLSLLPLAAHPVSAGERRMAVTYDCQHVRVQPRWVVFACGDGGFFVRRLEWHSWHRSGAKATGIFHMNDCRPSCAEGEFHTRTGVLRLRGRTWCPGIERHVFDRAITRFEAPLVGRLVERFDMLCP